ncbi:MAG: hypothetical protein HY320_10395 [Armatimonadetes bacterium]|nr:hypothetical protein [Armatimonadota bacterium]
MLLDGMADHGLHLILVVLAVAGFFVAPPSIAIPVLAAVIAATIATSIAVNRALRAPIRTGNERIVGETATVVEWEGRTGLVRHRGELWRATSASLFRPRESVHIEQIEGTLLRVRPEDASKSPAPARG